MLITTLEADKEILALIRSAGGPANEHTITADVASTSADLANVSSLTGTAIGDVVSGAGIPAGATVVAMDNAVHTATLSEAATATAVGETLTIHPQYSLGLLNGCKVMLFKNAAVPDRDTVLADLEEADYSGYAQKTVAAWGAVFVNADGEPETVAPVLQFDFGVGVSFCTVFGYAILDPTGTVLLAAERFDDAVQMNGPGEATVFVPRMTYPPDLGGVPV